MIFSGVNRVQMAYGVYGCQRAGGSLHAGLDVDTPGPDTTVYATVDGTVEFAGMVPKGADRTWEWGWHVRLLDAQGRRHTYAHCAANSLRVAGGQRVNAGDALGTLGNSGNAADNTPPYKHVHYQVDIRANGAWAHTDPTRWAGIENRTGVWENTEGAGMKETSVLLLEVFGDKNCEYFASMDVNDVAGRLAVGHYLVTAQGGRAGGFEFCKAALSADGGEFYVAVLPDRSTLRTLPAGEAARLLCAGQDGTGTGARQEVLRLQNALAAQSSTLAAYRTALETVQAAAGAALAGRTG